MDSDLQVHAREIFDAAVGAVRPDRVFAQPDVRGVVGAAVEDAERVIVLGFGKAAAAMAVALENSASRLPDAGAVIIPEEYLAEIREELRPRRICLLPGGHPHPTQASVESARKLMALATEATQNDVVIVLISGGGSALFGDFAQGISLDDAARLNELLLASGASIDEVNAVRKHISVVSGGRLAAAIHPARCVSLAISDVRGDDPSVIASGPTVADDSTFEDAVDVIESRGLLDRVPESVRDHLLEGVEGRRDETVQSDDPRLGRSSFYLVARNSDALNAAAQRANELGYEVKAMHDLSGEAAEAGRAIAREIVSVKSDGPVCLLYGGETTVTLAENPGRGGRNQELALAAAIELSSIPSECVILSAGTDGIDGPTDAAGGIVSNGTAALARERGVDLEAALARHASYDALNKLGALIKTGPTHTNVMDVVIALRDY